MARPFKDGIDYFPMDTDFFSNRKIKLIRAEFGACGVMVVLAAFCLIYSNNGYYTRFDEEDELLLADDIGCGCTQKLVHEVIQGCCRRFIFSGEVLDAFMVLTSCGIQRRYLRAVAKRDNIPIISEYWLLDVNDRDDVPDGIRNKLAFRNVIIGRNPVNSTGNPVDSGNNSQSKLKESKVKETKRERGAAASPPTRAHFEAPSVEAVEGYCREQGLELDARHYCDYYAARGWQLNGRQMRDWQASVRSWAEREKAYRTKAKDTQAPTGRAAAATGYSQRTYGPGDLDHVYTDIMNGEGD